MKVVLVVMERRPATFKGDDDVEMDAKQSDTKIDFTGVSKVLYR